MKLSVSLPAEDVIALDEYVRKEGLPSRSAAVHRAVRLLRRADLAEDYAAAWAEWERSGDFETWEAVTSDGVR